MTCSVTKSCLILCNPMNCSTSGFPFLYYLPEFIQTHVLSIKSMMPSNHLILWHSLLLLPSLFPNIRVFSNELALHIKWPKYRSFSISPSSEYSGLISFRIDQFGLLAIQGTLKSLLQHHNSKASVLRHSVFFMVQLSHLYLTTTNGFLVQPSAYVSCQTLYIAKVPEKSWRKNSRTIPLPAGTETHSFFCSGRTIELLTWV